MKNHMTYKDYFGSVNFSEEDEVFHGKIEFIKALITYEGTDVKSLKKAFHEAVDDYLEICEAQGRKPEKIFKGSFNIRIKPEIHRQISIMSAEKDVNVNKFISDILEASVKNSSNISSQTTLQENTTLHDTDQLWDALIIKLNKICQDPRVPEVYKSIFNTVVPELAHKAKNFKPQNSKKPQPSKSS